ncbi:hypothetical protein Tco_1306440 [Tanacetum coccineum]
MILAYHFTSLLQCQLNKTFMLLVLKPVLLCLTKRNYVPWSSRLLQYAKSRLNGKLIYNSIMNGPYVRRMILEPGDPDREVHVNKTFHEQTDEELTEKELKHVEANDQAIRLYFWVFLKTSMLLLIVVKLLRKSGYVFNK